VLVGDALQSLAFELLSRPAPRLVTATQLEMVRVLAQASGSRGMAGGQALDIDAVGLSISLPELEDMHILRLGALASGAGQSTLQQLDHYAKAIGLAFQVQDDILDVTTDTHTLGKTQGKDEAANKPTYTSLLGLEGARQKAAELLGEALDALTGLNHEADHLRNLARYVVERSH